jgi:threonine aldolase
VNGKLTPGLLEGQLWALGDQHHAQPVGVSLTQSTECGTLYSPDEIGALADVAHRKGMKVHIDGARIANASAALGGDTESLRSFTVGADVDVISFGGTKNGMMYGEAVVYLDAELARSAPFVRKQVGQLPSKMRYVAAQFSAILTDGLWIDNGRNANEMAVRLYNSLRDLPSLELRSPAVNSLFPALSREHARELRAWCPFYDWDVAAGTVRWMTAWDTTAEDVDRFACGVREVLGRAGLGNGT